MIPPLPPTDPLLALDENSVRCLVRSRLRNGSAPGPDCLSALCVLTCDVLNGNVDDRSRDYLTASALVSVGKDEGGFRPIAIGESFYKLACLYGLSLVHGDLTDVFAPTQFGVGVPGGPERAVHIIQSGLSLFGKDSVVLKCDFRNAFNERNRPQMLQELFGYPALRPLWRLAHWAYRAPSQLLVIENGVVRDVLQSAEGVKQGDGLGALSFSVSTQRFFTNAVYGLHGVRAVAVADDLNLVGRYDSVFAAFDRFVDLTRDSGLVLQRYKCGVLWPRSEDVPARLRELAGARQLPVVTGSIRTLGTLVGNDRGALKAFLKHITDGYGPLTKLLSHERMSVQVALLILRHSIIPSFNYLSRIVPPPLLAPHCVSFYTVVLRCVSGLLGLPSLSRMWHLKPWFGLSCLVVSVSGVWLWPHLLPIGVHLLVLPLTLLR